MSKLYNLARVETTTTGSGTLTLGDAVVGCLTFANAGVVDGDTVSYSIVDGNNTESGHGTYASAGPTLARTTVYSSTNSGSVISLSGNAQVAITVLAEDMLALQTSGILQVELYNETLSGSGIFDTDGVDLSGYDHLRIYLSAESDVAAELDAIHVFFNNDTTVTNYVSSRVLQESPTSLGGVTADMPNSGLVSGADATTYLNGMIIMDIMFYLSGKQKYLLSRGMHRDDSKTRSFTYGVHWENTAAITRITLQPDGYSTDEFVAGSICQIIGIKTVA